MRSGGFSTDKGFHSVINPQGVKTLVVRKKSSNTWLYAVSGVAVIVALAILIFLVWGDKIAGNVSVVKSADTEQVAPAVAESAATSEQTVQPAEAETQNAAVQQAQPAEAEVTQPIVSLGKEYAYYVVMGIFSTPENAERAVQQAQSKIKDVECKVLPFKGGKHMVAIFGSDNVADCNAFARSYRDIYPDLWVYNKK